MPTQNNYTDSNSLLPAHLPKPEFDIEAVRAIYFPNAENIFEPRKLHRIYVGGKRYYFWLEDVSGDLMSGRLVGEMDSQFRVHYYPSVTTIIHAVVPKSEFLVKWQESMGGIEEANKYRDEAAAYGTCMHMVLEDYLTHGFRMDLSLIPGMVSDYLNKSNQSYDPRDWYSKLERDLLAFHQFCLDYEIEPLGVELVLASDQFQFAGAVDLVAKFKHVHKEKYLDYSDPITRGPRKGQPREKTLETDLRLNGIFDYKSGRKGFYDSHAIQLHCYKPMVEENFPGLKIHKLFNWSPKDWITEPGYNLKDQTESKAQHVWEDFVNIFKKLHPIRPSRKLQRVSGIVDKGTLAKDLIEEVDFDEGLIAAMTQHLRFNDTQIDSDEQHQ